MRDKRSTQKLQNTFGFYKQSFAELSTRTLFQQKNAGLIKISTTNNHHHLAEKIDVRL
jgi:hypothetical protein